MNHMAKGIVFLANEAHKTLTRIESGNLNPTEERDEQNRLNSMVRALLARVWDLGTDPSPEIPQFEPTEV